MHCKTQIAYLDSQTTPANSSDEAIQEWHAHKDSLAFLRNSSHGDTAIYVSVPGFFVYSLIVPLERLAEDYIENILQWNFTASPGYGCGYSFQNDIIQPHLCQPIEHTGSSVLNGSNPVFFLRDNPFQAVESACVEINQQVCHVIGAHWLSGKKAWCKLNDLGETTPIAFNIREGNVLCCTLERSELDFYLFTSQSCLIRVFDVSRSENWMAFDYNEAKKQRVEDRENEIFAMHGICHNKKTSKPQVSLLRGFQIIRCGASPEAMESKLKGEEQRNYEAFIIHDWKNNRIIEWISDPDQHGNYFVESELPYGTSPAFFKPEVLLRYKQDPKRYRIQERIIECKWAWSLQYDVNEEGQIHVYICDLANLPHQEQLYWKSFNEKPRGGISKRAFKTDFQASWDLDYDPLRALKEILAKFPDRDCGNSPCPIWKMPKVPETRDVNFLNYVVTETRKEWEDQISALAQILVEGLSQKYIIKLAEELNCRDEEKKLRSIKLLEKIMEAKAVPDTDIKMVTKPLVQLWGYRSELISHSGKVDLTILEPRQHFRELLQACEQAMRKLADLVMSGILTI